MGQKYITVPIRVGSENEEVPKMIFSGTKTKTYENYAAITELSDAVQDHCNKLDADGYDIVSIIPVIRGHWDSKHYEDSGAGWGYSVTDGVVITAKLRD